VLNVLALAIGTAIMIVSVAWVRGYFTSLFEGIIRLDTGHAQVLPEGYMDERRRFPLDLSIADYESLRDRLLVHEEVVAVAGRLSFTAEIGDGTRSTRMVGRAIEPEREARITVLPEHIERGSYLDPVEAGVLLSEEIAGRLGVDPGAPIFITAVDQSGAENFTESVLAGTFALGYPAIDENMFFIDLASAQRLLGMPGEVTRLVLRLDSGPSVGRVVESIRGELPGAGYAVGDRSDGGRTMSDTHGADPGGTAGRAKVQTDAEPERSGLRIYRWRRFVEVIVSAVEADIAGFSIILAVLFLLVVIGILNSMSMAVHERRKEIGTLRAIGMKRAQLMQLFLAEGASISLIGAAVGAVLAGLVGIWIGIVGFDLSALAGTGLPVPFGDRFTADFRVWDFLLGAAISLLTALAGSLIPTRRASKTAIADALGSHLQ
jgi:putative ABC transport system permease protein